MESIPYDLSRLRFTETDSVVACAYVPAMGFYPDKYVGIRVYNLHEKILCYDYTPPEGYMVTGAPGITDNLVTIATYPAQTFPDVVRFVVCDCQQGTLLYSKQYSSADNIQRSTFSFTNKGVTYKTFGGQQMFDRYEKETDVQAETNESP